MDIEQFRKDMPEFADGVRFPVATIRLWSDVAEKVNSADNWGDIYGDVINLYTAHYLALAATNAKTGIGKGIPGSAGVGVVSSKTVGSVSVAYATNLGMNPNDGVWGLTTYGRQYAELVRTFGAIGYQLS